jgi:hypothetical protein
VADPLPAVRSLFPHAQARSRLCWQSLEIDRLLHRNHIGNHDIIATHGRPEIVKFYLADAQVFNQGYLVGPVARSIWMKGLKTLSDFILHGLPILRLNVFRTSVFPFFRRRLLLSSFWIDTNRALLLSTVKSVGCQSCTTYEFRGADKQ